MKIIGLMSGTSLDGLDLCYVNFTQINESYNFEIIHTKNVEYSKDLEYKLRNSIFIKSDDLLALNIEYGEFLSNEILEFIKEFNIKNIDGIASHGHTVFHQPERKISLQIGCGKTIFYKTNINTVHNFRFQDVVLGGQGAPFVPIGDKLLFSEYDACLNFGGFSNISYQKNNQRIGFDICPINMPLNYLANLFGKSFDKNGEIASKNQINNELIQKLNDLDYYKITEPKSLGIEWFDQEFKPIIDKYSKEEAIASVTEHCAIQVSKIINDNNFNSVLITGGGAKNTFLINKIQEKVTTKIIIPSTELIDFKEALIFAFMGFLRLNNKNNVLASVTGAKFDHSTGEIN